MGQLVVAAAVKTSAVAFVIRWGASREQLCIVIVIMQHIAVEVANHQPQPVTSQRCRCAGAGACTTTTLRHPHVQRSGSLHVEVLHMQMQLDDALAFDCPAIIRLILTMIEASLAATFAVAGCTSCPVIIPR